MASPATVPILAAYSIEGGDLLVLARLYVENLTSHNLVAAVAADVDSITRSLISLTDGTTVVNGPTNLDVSTTMLSGLSTGSIWRADSTGFNVRDQIPGSVLVTLPGVECRYVFTLSGGTVVPMHIVVDLKPS